jgi:hypothetical protein
LLADHTGMNVFAAIVVLSRVDLNVFLKMTSVERMAFGSLIGERRVVRSSLLSFIIPFPGFSLNGPWIPLHVAPHQLGGRSRLGVCR